MAEVQERQQPSGGSAGSERGFFSRLALFIRQVIAELRKVIWPALRTDVETQAGSNNSKVGPNGTLHLGRCNSPEYGAACPSHTCVGRLNDAVL